MRILKLVKRTHALDKLDALKLVIPVLGFWEQHLVGGDIEGHDVLYVATLPSTSSDLSATITFSLVPGMNLKL